MTARRLAEVPQSSGSLAPMSMVTRATWPRWALRNATAAASWEPPRYRQIPPWIMVAVVSPGQPSFTSCSAGWLRRSTAYS